MRYILTPFACLASTSSTWPYKRSIPLPLSLAMLFRYVFVWLLTAPATHFIPCHKSFISATYGLYCRMAMWYGLGRLPSLEHRQSIEWTKFFLSPHLQLSRNETTTSRCLFRCCCCICIMKHGHGRRRRRRTHEMGQMGLRVNRYHGSRRLGKPILI